MRDEFVEISPELIPDAEELPGSLKEVANVIGVESTLRLAQAFKGCSIYIHNVDSLIRRQRNRDICQERDQGATVLQLARKHCLSTRQIENILNSPE